MTYSYGSYFTLNANGRFDASNQFGSRSNEKLLPVWSVSGMFNAKEVFLPKVDKVNELRMRLSYGKTGNMVDGHTPNLLGSRPISLMAVLTLRSSTVDCQSISMDITS